MNFYPIRIRFHNGSGKWFNLAEAAIKAVSDKIHVEAEFPDGRSFSSVSRKEAVHGGNGPRFTTIDYNKHPERWTTYVLWVTKEELESILFDCELLAILEMGYDFQGAAGCAITGQQSPWDWFCSEVIFDRVMTKWLSYRLNYRMHPDRLEELVQKAEVKLLERKFNVDGI